MIAKCTLCGTRDDAFGCYEACTAGGPPHTWFPLAPTLRDVLKIIDTVDPVAQAAHSFDDYHAPGLSYLNVFRSPRWTGKIYFFQPGVWAPSAGRYVVHPHNHGYDFSTLVVAGAVKNVLFKESDREPCNGTRWNFTPVAAQRNTPAGFAEPQDVCLEIESERVYLEGETYAMEAEEIHTIAVSPSIVTALFLLQSETVAQTTRCYFPVDELAPDLRDLYKPMTPERYAEQLARVRALIEPPARRTLWVCGACGKSAPTRDGLRDTSCQTWAVEVWGDTVQRRADGRVCAATAIGEKP